MRNKPLTVEIVDGMLSISIGVDILCHAINVAHGKQQGFKITDNDVFANEILMELLYEDEDVNQVHRMLDYAAQCSIEYGGEGFELLPLPSVSLEQMDYQTLLKTAKDYYKIIHSQENKLEKETK